MRWEAIALIVLPDHHLEVTFADGLKGIVDLSQEPFEGVFAPLADQSYFAKASLQNGVITWPNGADLAPDALYGEI